VHYVDHADRYDRQLQPFTEALLDRAGLTAGDRVLDVGCGCGATTLAAARAARRATGVDLSTSLVGIAAARARAGSLDNAEFLVADAQTHRFADGTAERVISQFGVMFFDDPVSAFANLRRALVPGGAAVFVCWRALEVNEWLTVVGDAVAAHAPLPALGGRARGPGMFSLQDPHEGATLLDAAGFGRVEFEPVSPEILLGGGGTLEESMDFLLGMGMVRGLLERVGPDLRPAVLDTVRASLADRHEPGVGVRLGAGAWMVTAAA
jgi:SAM-dependent methyltransferase